MTPKEKLVQYLQEWEESIGKPLIPNAPEYADMVVSKMTDVSGLLTALVMPGMSTDEFAKLRDEFRPLAVEVLSEAGYCECGTKRTEIKRCPECGVRWP